ncbi:MULTISPECIES: MBOAT family O-acyltransferase [unclassified Sphingomonas]|uniref:MBOAT family O-acyltransferase n=1 Tax=unclassified Sphingomonas TaxID=196159 RepID=UPI0006F47216|nr:MULTISPECIES: MBOAT family O-acyltransferase [unclassified Sphingomonas]KQX20293.1 hypothetical protein ASD17_10545 [Sphingomonas sp. Root1294]KQY67543.1 hypothetical protein ASD39_10605 [Sphingomonas sp. Root50]KRB90920.1 hypothetical protein ASE22_11610 [Sphingomonas sp. Root720]
MQVTSPAFFLLTIAGCLLLLLLRKSETSKKWLLILLSLLFYATYDVRFILILGFVGTVSHFTGNRIFAAADHEERSRWLWAGTIVGLLPLLLYKYLPVIPGAPNLLAPDLRILEDWIGAGLWPIGISFYTFQALSYPFDIHRGRLKKPAPALDYACFITFFPKLLVGPISRATDFLPQLERPIRIADGSQASTALFLIAQGLIKKLVIADILGNQFVNPAFAHPEGHAGPFLLTAIFAYSFQVYFDLSGYTDIVRGAARLMGFELPINFARPYLAASISNFWQRWHISMSSFFRDYLYFALGGAKYGNVYVNLLITFVAIGMWHGSTLNFALYGLIHGSLVCWERYRRKSTERRGRRDDPQGAGLVVAIAATFTIISFARILFRADTVEKCLSILAGLTNFGDFRMPVSDVAFLVLGLAALSSFLPDRWMPDLEGRFARWPAPVQAMAAGCAVFVCFVLPTSPVAFIYARF